MVINFLNYVCRQMFILMRVVINDDEIRNVDSMQKRKKKVYANRTAWSQLIDGPNK